MEYKEPLCLDVKYELSQEFVSKVNSEKGCSIQKVIEVINCKVLQYWVDCPDEKKEQVIDYAFMTWIRNPKFQKYYLETAAFKEIAAKYEEEANNPVKVSICQNCRWGHTLDYAVEPHQYKEGAVVEYSAQTWCASDLFRNEGYNNWPDKTECEEWDSMENCGKY